MSMPPYELWLRGRESIARWLLGPGHECRGSRLIATSACGGTPAFAQYRHDGETPWALVLLDLAGGSIAGLTFYLDVQTLFPRFGLPLRYAERPAIRASTTLAASA